MSILRGCLRDLPTYSWLAVLPQLISRVCHQNDEVIRLLKSILTKVVQTYPQQSLWYMASVSKSIVAARKEQVRG
jgi:serine/threonine-protein kinase ATR